MKISRGMMLATAGAAAIGLLGILFTRGHMGVEARQNASGNEGVRRPGRETRFERFSRLRGAIEEQIKLRDSWLREHPGKIAPEWPDSSQQRKLFTELAEHCGPEGELWLEESDPEGLMTFRDLWMQLKPREMLDFIESTREQFCPKGQLQELLQLCANSDGEALRAECRKIPWDLLLTSDHPKRIFSQEYIQGHPPEGYHYLDAALWGQSGAARDLAEQGVEMFLLFKSWAQADAGSALENCIDWPNTESNDATERLRQCLWSAGPSNFQELSPELQEQMKPLILGIIEERNSQALDTRARAVAASLGLQVPEPTSPPEPGY